jgi:hypothetical protein
MGTSKNQLPKKREKNYEARLGSQCEREGERTIPERGFGSIVVL